MHPVEVRPFLGHDHQQKLSDPIPAPTAEAVMDAVPVTEVGRQIPPEDSRTHQVHDPVQEEAEVIGMAGADLGIPAQVAVQGGTKLGIQRCAACGGTSGS